MSPATDTRTNSCWRTWFSDCCLAGGTVESHVAGTLSTIVALLWDIIENITSKHLQSCFSLHISGILSDSMHTRSTVYQDCIKATMYVLSFRIPTWQTVFFIFLRILEGDDVTQKSSVGPCTDKRPYFQMHNIRLASSWILPGQHINFMYLLHLQNIAGALCRQLTVPTYLKLLFAECKTVSINSVLKRSFWFSYLNKLCTTYPISRADLSVAAGGAGEGGELGDGDALLAAADLVVSTLCPILYEARVHCACLWLGSEGATYGWRREPYIQIFMQL